MRRFFQQNSLSIVSFTLFFLFWAGMAVVGYVNYNEEQQEQGQAQTSFLPYLSSGHFWEATFENWESEFLQMGLFVLLTAYLFQKGSAESKTRKQREEEQKQEDRPQHRRGGKSRKEDTQVPGPVRRGGPAEKLYENSLSIVLLAIFALCVVFHAVEGAREYNQEQAFFHKPPIGAWQFFRTSEFWFQAFQNWQSEFLSVGAMVVLTIFLRQKGSSESKDVAAPHSQTGE